MEEEIGNSMTEPYKKSHIIRRNVYQEILQKYRSIIGLVKRWGKIDKEIIGDK